MVINQTRTYCIQINFYKYLLHIIFILFIHTHQPLKISAIELERRGRQLQLMDIN